MEGARGGGPRGEAKALVNAEAGGAVGVQGARRQEGSSGKKGTPASHQIERHVGRRRLEPWVMQEIIAIK